MRPAVHAAYATHQRSCVRGRDWAVWCSNLLVHLSQRALGRKEAPRKRSHTTRRSPHRCPRKSLINHRHGWHCAEQLYVTAIRLPHLDMYVNMSEVHHDSAPLCARVSNARGSRFAVLLAFARKPLQPSTRTSCLRGFECLGASNYHSATCSYSCMCRPSGPQGGCRPPADRYLSADGTVHKRSNVCDA